MERYHDQALALVENVLLFRLGQACPAEVAPAMKAGHQELPEQSRSAEATEEALTLDETLQRFERRYGRLRWLHGASRSKAVFMSKLSDLLRHRSPGRVTLARKVVGQAIDHGLDLVLAGTTREARRFLEQSREVRADFHRLVASAILLPDGNSLVTYLEPLHEVGDLVAMELGRRYGDREVLVMTPGACYQVAGRRLTRVTDPSLARVLRHRALRLSEAERYWQQASLRVPVENP